MSLKNTAMKMAIAFAAAKGYQAFRQRGGMQGVKDMLSQGSASGGGMGGSGRSQSGGLGGLMGGLGSGGGSGGLGGLLGMLGGGTSSGMGRGSGGGMSGLLGGLAAMAGGGAAAAPADHDARMDMAARGPQDEETAAAMVRAIGQAVRSDGEIDAKERAVLDQIMGDAETDRDREMLETALSEPVNPEALARDVPRGHEGEVYAAALTAIDPDHPGEKDFLHRFATALALDPAEIRHIHETAEKHI